MTLSEDIVRDRAREILGFYNDELADSGTGQITTFNQLDKKYFKGINYKPDSWYFPKNISQTAIILETKAPSYNKSDDVEKDGEQLFKYMQITNKKYKKVLGILYNGEDVLCIMIRKSKLSMSIPCFIKAIISNLPIESPLI